MFQFKTTVAIVAIASLPLSAAHAQSYYGAGSTLQPSRQYQQLQQEQARRAQQYYYVPAAPAQRQTDQSRYMAYPDRSLGAIGYPQVPVYLSPQAADRIANQLPRCVAGTAFGYAQGGLRGGAVGLVQGCSGW